MRSRGGVERCSYVKEGEVGRTPGEGMTSFRWMDVQLPRTTFCTTGLVLECVAGYRGGLEDPEIQAFPPSQNVPKREKHLWSMAESVSNAL